MQLQLERTASSVMTMVIGTAHNVFFLAPFIKFIVIFDVVCLHAVPSALQNNRVKFISLSPAVLTARGNFSAYGSLSEYLHEGCLPSF